MFCVSRSFDTGGMYFFYVWFGKGGILDRTGYQQLIVRCSDDGVVCESYKRQTGEPQDVFIKVI